MENQIKFNEALKAFTASVNKFNQQQKERYISGRNNADWYASNIYTVAHEDLEVEFKKLKATVEDLMQTNRPVSDLKAPTAQQIAELANKFTLYRTATGQTNGQLPPAIIEKELEALRAQGVDVCQLRDYLPAIASKTMAEAQQVADNIDRYNEHVFAVKDGFTFGNVIKPTDGNRPFLTVFPTGIGYKAMDALSMVDVSLGANSLEVA